MEGGGAGRGERPGQIGEGREGEIDLGRDWICALLSASVIGFGVSVLCYWGRRRGGGGGGGGGGVCVCVFECGVCVCVWV